MSIYIRLVKSKSSSDSSNIVVCIRKKGPFKGYLDNIGFIKNFNDGQKSYLIFNKKRLALWVNRGGLLSKKLQKYLLR